MNCHLVSYTVANQQLLRSLPEYDNGEQTGLEYKTIEYFHVRKRTGTEQMCVKPHTPVRLNFVIVRKMHRM